MRMNLAAAFAIASLAGCSQRSTQAAADSARSIELARSDSIYRINDRPANPAPAPLPPAAPAPEAPRPKRPPAPAPAPSRSRTLDAGTTLEATTDRMISSRTDHKGAAFTASIATDVKDDRGRIVIPAGSVINLTITELQPAKDKGQADGKITIMVNSVTVDGVAFPVSGEITSMAHTLKGRGVSEAEIEKTAAGAVIGGVAGRIIGGNAKGTVIGVVIGGAAGAVVAAQTADRDVVVVAGTPMVITLRGPLTITKG